MKFNIQQDDLKNKLALAQRVVDKKSVVPILSHVLITTEHDTIRLTTTDLEIVLSATCRASILRDGQIAVPARKLYEITKEIPEQEIAVEEIENHWILLKAGSAVFKLAGLSSDEFPSIPSPSWGNLIPISAEIIKEMIAKTEFAIFSDPQLITFRRNLAGIYIEKWDHALRFVATDGHRLSMIQRSVSEADKLTQNVLIPTKGVRELKKMADMEEVIEINCNDTFFFAKGSDTTLIVRLIDKEFPDYHHLIPGADKKYHSFMLNRIQFLSALKKMLVFPPDATIILSEKGMILKSMSGIGEGEEVIPMEGQANLTIKFNVRYLIDALQSIDANIVQLGLAASDWSRNPAILQPSDDSSQMSLIMPMMG